MATPQVEKLVGIMKEYLQKNPVSYVLIVLFVLQQIMAMRRQSELVATLRVEGEKVSPDAKAKA